MRWYEENDKGVCTKYKLEKVIQKLEEVELSWIKYAFTTIVTVGAGSQQKEMKEWRRKELGENSMQYFTMRRC